MRGMRNAYYSRDNFDVRRGGRGFSCAVKNTLISQKDAVDTRTFRVKPNTPKLLSMPGKNGGQLWDLPSISMVNTHLIILLIQFSLCIFYRFQVTIIVYEMYVYVRVL